uniref:Uncharacterized protein LOC104265604 n=1 Tax=Phallusia mammillata TaxID=59560 RepID=A0A6F9DI92_9ASCI|nr:uncharacterized protein LOC104265604 [Phallusia mammillata]
MRAIQHVVFNSQQNELITTGIAGTTIWKYQQMTKATFHEIKPMANYSLIFKSNHHLAEDMWCTKVHLEEETQQLYFCCDTALFVYNAHSMKLLWQINNAHGSALTSIAYWLKGKMLVTGGMDAEVKVWSSLGGHICTFRGHSRPVTSIVVHPHLNGFVMSASLDGTVKVWSLSMLELIYSYSVFADGIDWMSVTPDGYVWCATVRQASL